jgi:hypothetical protein
LRWWRWKRRAGSNPVSGTNNAKSLVALTSRFFYFQSIIGLLHLFFQESLLIVNFCVFKNIKLKMAEKVLKNKGRVELAGVVKAMYLLC